MNSHKGKSAIAPSPEALLVPSSFADVLHSPDAPTPDEQPSDVEPDNEAGKWRIWVMDADGSQQRLLDVGVELSYGFGDEQMVSWGPE